MEILFCSGADGWSFFLSLMLTVIRIMKIKFYFLSQMLTMETIKFYFYFSDAGCVSSVEQMAGARVSSGGGGFSNSFL